MDEAVAGHANWIEVEVEADGIVTVTDNGRGIPIDPHPKFRDKSALEIIMTTLHAGGKFDSKVYETSGGLHGVGVSVVNALSDKLEVEVARDRKLYRQSFSRGKPLGKLKEVGEVHNRRGTKVRFHPDPQIFGAKARFDPDRLFRMTRSKAYLFGGVEIRWSCASGLIAEKSETPQKAVFRFPGGLRDYLAEALAGETLVGSEIFAGKIRPPGRPWLGGMGDRLVCRGRIRPLLLQHDPDGRRRQPRGRIAERAPARVQVLRRPHRQQARRRHHLRRHHDFLRRHAVGFPARAGIRRADQGPPGQRGSCPRRRERDPRRLRPLAGGLARAGDATARLGGRAGGGTSPPPPREGDLAQDGDAKTAASGQARRLQLRSPRRHGAVHRGGRFRRRLGQAGARPANAGDPPACAEKS